MDRVACARGLLAVLLGALFGFGVSWIVNCTLVEISTNFFFALYFGLLFILIGVVIVWRVNSSAQVAAATARKRLLLGFSSMVILSGVLCFIVEKNVLGLSVVARVPIFTVLGISVCFALTFSFIDLFNWAMGQCQAVGSAPLVETPQQVYLLLGVSVVMGAAFGLIFGLLDVEDATMGRSMKIALLKEESYCYPIGMVLGALAALMNHQAREKQSYDLLSQQDFYDDGAI